MLFFVVLIAFALVMPTRGPCSFITLSWLDIDFGLAGIFFCLSTLMSSFFFYYLSTEYWRDQLQQQLERRPGFLCPTTHISPCPHPIPGTHQSGQGIKLKQDYTSTLTHSLSLVSLSSILTPLCSRPQMQADLDIWILSSQGRNFWQTHAHARTHTHAVVYISIWGQFCVSCQQYLLGSDLVYSEQEITHTGWYCESVVYSVCRL